MQLYFLLQRYTQQSELAQEDLFAQGGVVSDYLFAKDRLFASLNLSPEELRLYDRIYQALAPRAVAPDLVVYLQARTEVLLDRIARRGRREEAPIEPDYVRRVAEAYAEFFFNYTESPLLIVERFGHRLRGQPGGPARAGRRHPSDPRRASTTGAGADGGAKRSPPSSCAARKGSGEKIVVLTAYDVTFARLADRAGVDVVLVGDSLGMVVPGAAHHLAGHARRDDLPRAGGGARGRPGRTWWSTCPS